MHARRLDRLTVDNALEYARRFEEPQSPENDNAAELGDLSDVDVDKITFVGADDDEAPPPPETFAIVRTGPSRRAWIAAALVTLTLSLTAFAATRPRATARSTSPPVTQVDVAARGAAVTDEASAEGALMVVPDAPTSRRTRSRQRAEHLGERAPETTSDERPAVEHHAHEAPESTASEAATVAASEPTREAPTEGDSAATQDDSPTQEALPTDSADEVVERAVNDHTAAIEACIDAADDSASGRVVVHLVIARDGAVRSATPHGPTSLASVGRCLAHEMSDWRMVVPDAAGDTSISWPFEVESNAE
jgi:hypothetical protein